ncbi:MAG TPA: PEP-CTERM sorting domain-containing protein [Bryobacteraceae bacterium]|nr:PEP-CTERM sorting domain-containing protein [Bryobacteraceae bacterium]
MIKFRKAYLEGKFQLRTIRMLRLTITLLSSVFLSSASAIYDVNQTVGAGRVTGFIETDGTVGVLGASKILDWNLLLNDGTTTFDLLGPLSGSNSALGLVGSDLSATATLLLFNFSGSDSGYVLFQSPHLFTGSDFWCLASSNGGCSSEPIGETINVSPDPNQFTSVSGTVVVASVPEPSTLCLLGAGFGVIGFSKWRNESQRGRRSQYSSTKTGGRR